MARWRILKEKPARKKERTDDLSSWTKFIPTGETFQGEQVDAEAHIALLQAEQGGCFGLELID